MLWPRSWRACLSRSKTLLRREGRGLDLAHRQRAVGEPAPPRRTALCNGNDPAADRHGLTRLGAIQPGWAGVPSVPWAAARVLRRRGPTHRRIGERKATAVGLGRG